MVIVEWDADSSPVVVAYAGTAVVAVGDLDRHIEGRVIAMEPEPVAAVDEATIRT